MARTQIIMLTLAASLCAGAAVAQTEADPAQDTAAQETASKAAPEAKFIRAQFVRPGDVSPEEYARLVKEAERIRAYQAAQAPSGAQVTYNAASQNQGYVQTQAQTYQQPLYQQQPSQPFAPALTVTQPQSYADYMSARGQQLQTQGQVQVQQQAQAQPGQTVYYQQQPIYVQQQPQPRTVQNYQTPNPNTVTYAAMPDVMGTGAQALPGTQYVTAQYGHAVIKGDTLYNISKRYGVALNSLKQANGLTGDIISIGQTLAIPRVAASQVPVVYQYVQPAPQPLPVYQQGQAPAPVYIQQPQTPQQRTVQQPVYNPQTGGYTQTISTTASGTQFIRSVQAVPPSGLYAVLPKDTIYSIAKFACVRPDEVARINGISNAATLQPGQKLTMPAGHCL